MGKLVADITMSLDGFITGPDDAPGRGLGQRAEVLHNWVMGGPWRYDESRHFAPLDVDLNVLQQAMTRWAPGSSAAPQHVSTSSAPTASSTSRSTAASCA
jgi:hypothetical protein